MDKQHKDVETVTTECKVKSGDVLLLNYWVMRFYCHSRSAAHHFRSSSARTQL